VVSVYCLLSDTLIVVLLIVEVSLLVDGVFEQDHLDAGSLLLILQLEMTVALTVIRSVKSLAKTE